MIIRLNENNFYKLLGKIISRTLNEEVTNRQLRNSANRNATEKGSVKIDRASNGELTTVKVNKITRSKGALSRIVIKTYNNGHLMKPRIINGTQDKLIRVYNNMLKQYQENGFSKIYTKKDSVLNHPCTLLVSNSKPLIMCIFIETDNLIPCDAYFDLDNVKNILERNGIDTGFYKFPDVPQDQIKVRRPRINNMRDNWGWIENGKPRKWRT